MFPGFVLKKCVLGLLVFPGSNLPFSWQKPAFFHPPHVFPERQAPPVASELPATGSRGVVRGPQRPTCGTLKPPRTPFAGFSKQKNGWSPCSPMKDIWGYGHILGIIDQILIVLCIYIYPILAQNTKKFFVRQWLTVLQVYGSWRQKDNSHMESLLQEWVMCTNSSRMGLKIRRF